MKFLISAGLALLGIAIGCVLGVLVALTYISSVFVSADSYESTLASISYDGLVMSPGIEWECGIVPSDACRLFTMASFENSVYESENALKVATGPDTRPITEDFDVQPAGGNWTLNKTFDPQSH